MRRRYLMLGPLEVFVAGHSVPLGGPQQRTLLAVLLSEPDRAVPVDRLLDLLWSDEPPDRAAATLQTYVSNLRRVLEPDRPPRGSAQVLLTQPPGYLLRVVPDELDAAEFERLAAEGHALLREAPLQARAALDAAIGLWRGEPFEEMGDAPWAHPVRDRLRELLLGCREDRFTVGLSLDEASMLADLAQFVSAHPEREGARGTLMRALYERGRQAEALRVYDEGRRWLADEKGLQPSVELQELQHAILTQRLGRQLTPAHRSRRITPSTTSPSGSWEPRLVGRRRELDAIAAAWDRAGRCQGSVLLVDGEPGSGKTRLLGAAVEQIADEGVMLVGRALESVAAPPLWPWPEMLAATPLASAVPANPSPQSRAQLFAGVVQWLRESATSGRPALLVIDDADRCGADAGELLAAIARSTEALPLVVLVAVGRPMGSGAASTWFADVVSLPWAQRLELTPFTRADTAEVVAAIRGGPADDTVVDLLHTRADGNPFFTVELARRFSSGGSPSDDAPTTVRDVVRGRLTRLPGETVRLLRIGALLGRAFDVTTVADVASIPLAEAATVLEPAEAVGVVVRGERLGALRFVHGIVRDAIAADLGPHDRRRLHVAVAEALERRFGDEPDRAGEIASHHAEGLPLSDVRRTGEWLERAAHHATMALAFDDAIVWQRRRLEVVALRGGDPSAVRDELDARNELALLLTWRDGQAAAVVRTELERARELAARLDDVASAATALWGLWSGDCVRGDLRRAALRAEELLEVAGSDTEHGLHAVARIALAATNWQRGRFGPARDALVAARVTLARFEERSLADRMLQHPVVHCDVFDAMNSWFLGDHAGSARAMERAVTAAEAYDHAYSLQFARGFELLLAACDQRFEWVRLRAPSVLEATRRFGFAYLETTIASLAAWAAGRTGEPASVDELRQVLDRRDALEAGAASALLRGALADLLLVFDRPDDACVAAEAGLEAVEATDERYWEPELHRLKGRAILATGRSGPAREAFATAVAIATEQRAAPLLERALADLDAFDHP